MTNPSCYTCGSRGDLYREPRRAFDGINDMHPNPPLCEQCRRRNRHLKEGHERRLTR